MATDNERIAREIVKAVGGVENITDATHCMTRLRLNLKDASIPRDDELKHIDGVLGAQWSGGQYQVIIGQNVPKVYEAAVKLGVPGEGAVAETIDADVKQAWTPKKVGEAALNYLSRSMVPLIPIMLGAALCRTVAVIAGPAMLGIWSDTSAEYLLFYSWLYNAGFYFIPVYLGWSSAVQLGASPQLGMMLGGVLIAPDLMQMVSALAEGGPATTSVYGFPAVVNNYSSTVLPMLLCAPVMWQIERLFRKVVPEMLSMVFVPLLTLIVMVPVALCVLAPIGSLLGNALGDFMFGLGSTGGVVTVLVLVAVAALWEFLVMTGMHQVLITLAMANLALAGSDSCIMVAGTIAQFATWGMALGAFLRLKERDERAANLGYCLSGILGGVTEPALYGCGFKYLRVFAGMIVGGAVGGLIAGLAHVSLYVVGISNILAVTGFVAGGTANVLWGCAAAIGAFLVSAAVTALFGFSKDQLAEDAQAAADAEKGVARRDAEAHPVL